MRIMFKHKALNPVEILLYLAILVTQFYKQNPKSSNDN